jgi:Carboxypeptidase regulatory-like domain
MFNRSRIIAAVSLAFILGTFSARADSKSIQGTVTGTDGKPFAGAEIRANRLDEKAAPVVTKTDAQGHYTFKALPAGAYAVTAFVKTVPKMHATVRTRGDGWAKVDFDLRLKPNDASIKRKYVWVNGEPGSHIGGRWVPVEQANEPGVSAVDTIGADDVSRMQRDMRINNNTMGAGGPGH